MWIALLLIGRTLAATSTTDDAPSPTTSACKPGTTLARFVVMQPNSSSIVAVGGNAIFEWTYAPLAWAMNKPRSLSIFLQQIAPGVQELYNDVVVANLNVSNNATKYLWYPVKPLIDGNYKVRLVGDGKDTVLKNGQPNRDVCYADGDVMASNSAQFVVINPPYLAPVPNPLPAYSQAVSHVASASSQSFWALIIMIGLVAFIF
ncbi:hypothetical protein SeMB42_g00562 [Synchytrium endobioticum]|uniref:Uncharacterized protein n=1 Tax=Synchytrium endobioticum TaxID=286115 RepID=A0A507DFD9_9FUNG|nr:hypothetical protein SeLEV6574_g01156 [Synchytrium endobioticum]TPX53889.1 hypothetical protein SeMB42_g00562 [Synchytrium endobioticum]